MAIRVPPGGSSLGSFLSTTAARAFGGPRSQIVNGWEPDALSSPAALDIDFTTGTLDSRITFARGSTATYYNSSGLIASAASGAPRFDYDPSTLTARGLLLEEQRSNLITKSEVLDDAAWAKSGTTITADAAAAPDGTTTADLVTCSGPAFVYQTWTGGSAGSYTHSLYIKRGTANWVYLRSQSNVLGRIWFNINTGTVGTIEAPWTSPKIEVLPGGWLRLSAVATGLPGSLDYFLIALTDADNYDQSSGITAHIWGVQVEAGSFPTSYIPTTTVAVTRAADTAEMTGTNFSSWWNASAGTFVAEYRPQSISGTQPVISVNDTTADESIRLYGSGADPKAIVVDGGTTQADLDAGTIAAANAAFYKLGLAFTLNDFAACFEGGTVATDTAGTLPTVTQLQFHTDIAGNVANLHIKRLQFFNTRKSDSELQALTAPTITLVTGTGALVAQSAVATSTAGVSSSLITDTTLAADAAAVASTTGISRSLITDTTLAADAAVVASATGVSSSLITDTTLNASSAAVASTTGVSSSTITDTTIAADPAVVASTTGISRSLITDTTLAADPAVVVSTAGVSRSLITDTTIDAGVAAVASTTGLVRSINTANTLAAQAAVVASVTGLSRSIAPSSALAPQRSTVSGIGGAATGIAGTSVLNVLPAAVAGAGLSAVTGAGALQALAANSNGPGLSQFIGTGALFAEWAELAGLGSIPYSPFVSGPYTQVGDLWEGAAVWGKIDGKWRRMRLWSKSAAAWGMVAWDKDAQEVDVISEPAYGALAVRSANVNGAGFIRDQVWGAGELRVGPALVTDSSSLSGLSVITNAAWETTPLWLKVNGKWRRATMWTNVSEEWKRVA